MISLLFSTYFIKLLVYNVQHIVTNAPPLARWGQTPKICFLNHFMEYLLPMSIIASILPYAQIVLSIVLISLILLQRSEAGLGGAFGGSDGVGAGFYARRGLENTIYKATFVVAALFVIASLVSFFVN